MYRLKKIICPVLFCMVVFHTLKNFHIQFKGKETHWQCRVLGEKYWYPRIETFVYLISQVNVQIRVYLKATN